ncbi:acetate uptake transporter [Alicyclobacillus tolerans]|uniref:acetate uptake transporter n=1 Tax=Alicyclobacillus tolerans TaxID=90970 RepID=UPI003B7D0DE6
MQNHSTERWAEATPLGLAAFVISQTLLNLPNAHLVPALATTFFLPVILICGGGLYFLCCILEFIRKNTFGMTVNGFYGGFFSSLGVFLIMELSGFLKFGADANIALGTFLLIWSILTIPFVVAAFRENMIFGWLFFFVAIAFFGGAFANLTGLNSAIGGYAGLISAAIGLYLLTQMLMAATAHHALPSNVVNLEETQAIVAE